MANTVLLEKANNIATIILNRPDAMNSFNQEMADDLEKITQEVMDDEQIRAVLLRGAGNVFMAGGDIGFFYKRLDIMPEGVPKIIEQLHNSLFRLRNMDKPVLAAVHGSVAGAGVSIMLIADLVIAAENTKFNLAYTNIGTSPDGCSTYSLPRLVGNKRAAELMLLSNVFDAQMAQSYGMLNWVVPAEQVFTEADKLLQRLANGPTQAYARTKHLLNQTWENSIESQGELEGQMFTASTTTKDFKTGVTAFINKEKPVFTGE